MKQKGYINQIFYSILFLAGMNAFAQQLPQYTQYMLNDFVINPAIAGRSNWYEIKSNNRYQWVGLTDAPRTYILSLQGPLRNPKMGVGGQLYTDIVGPTRRTGIMATYAYHVKLNEEYKLSFGLNAGIVQWAVDGSKLILHDEGDLLMTTSYQSAIAPDFGSGLYLYSKKLYVSLGVPHIWRSNLKFFHYQTTKDSRLEPHIYGLAGYKFNIGEDFILEPSVMVKWVKPVPVKIDAGLKFSYQEKVWIGAAYRTKDAVTALIGYQFKEWLMFGYSYDITTTPIRKYSTGTHEVMLGIKLAKPESKTGKQTE